MKPNILICLYAYYPFENSNTNVMLPLIKKLSNYYVVDILTRNNDNSVPDVEIIDGINVYRFRKQNALIEFVQGLDAINEKKDRGFIKNNIVKLIKPVTRFLMKYPVFHSSEFKTLTRVLGMKSYCLVLSTCESFYSHMSVLAYKQKYGLSIPWIAYYMDPFAFYIGNVGKNDHLIERECKVYNESDLIIVTQEIYEENKRNVFSQFLHKTLPAKYGNFKCIENELVNPIFIEGKINCVYVGSLLDESVRSPLYLYKLINESDNKYVFHMVCNNFTKKNRKLRDKWLKANDKVMWYHNLPLAECLGIISHADILINLGNRSTNQTPSKVFDYIGTGRPIINLYSLDEDTSKKYLLRYPNMINVLEEDAMLLSNLERIDQFAVKNVGKTVERSELIKLFGEFLSDNVVHDTVKIICKVADAETG